MPGRAAGLHAGPVASSKIWGDCEFAPQYERRYVMDVADLVHEIPGRPPQAKIACMVSPCTANAPGQLTLPGAAFSDSSWEKRRAAAPKTLHACLGAMTKNLIGPNESNGRLIVGKLLVNWGHAPASQLKRILADADGMGNALLNV